MLEACLDIATQWAAYLTLKPQGKVPRSWEGIVSCPYQKAEPALGPGSLAALGYYLYMEMLLLQPGDFIHHHGLLLSLGGF